LKVKPRKYSMTFAVLLITVTNEGLFTEISN